MSPKSLRPALAGWIGLALLASCAVPTPPNAPPGAKGAAVPEAPPVAVASAPAAPPAAAAPVAAEAPPAAVTAAPPPAPPVAPAPPPAPSPVAAVPPPPPPPAPIVFEGSIDRAAAKLLAQAAPTIGDAPRVVVIDPLIDANTGQQTRSTVRMGELISYKIRNTYPNLTPKPLTRAALAGSPILMIGTLTPINTANAPDKGIDAYRVWLTLIDLKTGKIVGKALDRATVDSVDADPTAYYQESPTWHKDKTIAAYINSCQVNSKVGDFIDPAYLMRLPAAALINEALLAFDSGNMQEANQLFRDASTTSESGDLRVWNGLYLTSWRLGRKDEAQKAFSHVAAAGIAARKLPLKMLFAPGKAVTLQTGDLPKQYDLWVREISLEAANAQSCLRVSGHTTRTGVAAANEALSLARASFVQQRMEILAPQLKGKVTAVGMGAKENLVGIGTDDARDILDRRVEFGVVDCKSSGA